MISSDAMRQDVSGGAPASTMMAVLVVMVVMMVMVMVVLMVVVAIVAKMMVFAIRNCGHFFFVRNSVTPRAAKVYNKFLIHWYFQT